MFNLDSFISKYVTKRPRSMFLEDIENNRELLSKKSRVRKFLSLGVQEVLEVPLLKQFFHLNRRCWL